MIAQSASFAAQADLFGGEFEPVAQSAKASAAAAIVGAMKSSAELAQQAADEVIAKALSILAGRLRKPGAAMSSPQAVKDYLKLRSAEFEHEVFSVLFLDVQNRLIACEDAFIGTVSQCSVYPREIVKRALALNASAVILSHNHPSGVAEPSRADEHLTQTLKASLALVDIRVLDHVVVGGMSACSFAERGLL